MFFKKDAKKDGAKAEAAAETAKVEPAAVKASPANGAVPLDEEAKKRVAGAKNLAAALGQIVTLLMRSPQDRARSIADLEWMVVPGLLRGQFMIAEAHSKETGATGPVGFILWALVSPEVDKRLSDTSVQPKLAQADWKSGDIPWVVAGGGDQKILNGLLQKLTTDVYKGREIKMRVQGPDGKVTAGRIEFKTN